MTQADWVEGDWSAGEWVSSSRVRASTISRANGVSIEPESELTESR